MAVEWTITIEGKSEFGDVCRREVQVDKSWELFALNNKLDSLGLAYQSSNPAFEDFLRSLHRADQEERGPYTPEEVEAQNRFMQEIVEGLR
ncbi:hypothetical protein ACFSQQ_41405 [Mesorhizobium kowhaii]|uniref:hypothetical protein n=1 Tax=Mesorhizobium kowhaii TaxID=1300272 RepID=UPI0035ECED3D